MLLLVVAVLFSASLGVLHGRRKTMDSPVISDDIANIVLTKRDAFDYIDPLLLGGNVDTVARILHQFSNSVFIEVLDTVLKDEFRQLSNEQKIQMLLAGIAHDRTRTKQGLLIAKLANRFSGYPIYYNAVEYYGDIIPTIQSWIKRTGSQSTDAIWQKKSLGQSVDDDDVEKLQLLYTYNIRPTAQMASELLRRVVIQGKSEQFIPFLVDQTKADPNFSADGKRTVLIEAVEANSPNLVQALLKAGADPNIILDPAVGSARQIAFEKGYTSIDLMIREHR